MKKFSLIAILFILMICLCSCFGGQSSAEQSTTKVNNETQTKKIKEAKQTKKEEKFINKEETKQKNEKATQEPTQKQTEKAIETVKKAKKVETGTTGEVINIVLDAGHDSTVHTRNHPNLGVNEQDLNLKIAKACYKKLIKYDGIKVFLTRKDGTCPNSKYNYGNTSQYGDACIRARTQFAEEKKADIFISFHCNASSGELGASANGTEVYVSKHPEYYSTCKDLGEIVLRNITATIDVQSRGVLTRSKPEKGHYADGTVKDFYYLISNNIDNNRPAIIIEHAFMDNSHDNAILKDDSTLKKFGYADADAIAEYFGLSLQ